jgi:hypothetical protein
MDNTIEGIIARRYKGQEANDQNCQQILFLIRWFLVLFVPGDIVGVKNTFHENAPGEDGEYPGRILRKKGDPIVDHENNQQAGIERPVGLEEHDDTDKDDQPLNIKK